MARGEAKIRHGTKQDIPEVVELWKEFMDFHGDRDPRHRRSVGGDEHFASFLEANLASADSRLWVAECDSAVAGYCLARRAQRPPVFEERAYGEVLDLAVAGPFRRSGIGTKLFAEAGKWFQGQKINRVELRVSTSNELASLFWKQLGFRPYLQVMYREDTGNTAG